MLIATKRLKETNFKFGRMPEKLFSKKGVAIVT